MENGVTIEREFASPVEMLWKAWTDEELAKKWWGPEHFTAPIIKMDLRVGGKYLFAMHGPAGSQWDKNLYSAGVYKEIVPNKKLVISDYFSDENGNHTSPTEHGLESDMPEEMEVTILFEDLGNGKSKLTIKYPAPKTPEEAEAMAKSGMIEGWNTSLDKLSKVVTS